MHNYRYLLRHTLTALLLLAAQITVAQSLDFAVRAGGAVIAGEDVGQATATDAAGNIYITGYFSNTAVFGSTTLVSAGSEDVFLIKYDAAGTLLWVRQAGGSGPDRALGVAVNNSGVYITGFFASTADFDLTNPGTSQLTSAGGTDIFVAKYDADGAVQWLRRGGGSEADEGRAISIDNNGVYVTGFFNATANFNTPSAPGTNELLSGGSADIFVARYTPAGGVGWLKRAGGSGSDQGNGIAVGISGVYVTGSFSGTANFNTPSDPSSDTLVSAGDTDIFVAMYTLASAVQWFSRAGGSSADQGNAIAVDISGVYVTGDFQGTANFNTPSNASNNNLTSASGIDVFVARYTGIGGIGWLRRSGGNNSDRGLGIAVFNNGVYVTGSFENTANFNTPSNAGSNTLVSAGATDIFVAQYTSGGDLGWINRAGGGVLMLAMAWWRTVMACM